jgi:hypothetical protein
VATEADKFQMNFITEVFGQVIILLISGTIFSFIIWKLRKTKTDFGEFFNRYGEMLAYAGLVFIALVIGLIQWWTN